ILFCPCHEFGTFICAYRIGAGYLREHRLNRSKEKCFVLHDRSAERARHIVAFEWLILRHEGSSSIEMIVEEKIAACAVELVGPGLRSHSHLYRACAAFFDT